MKEPETLPPDGPAARDQDRASAVRMVIILWFGTIAVVLAGLVWLVGRLMAIGG
jgi:hypothetical protein